MAPFSSFVMQVSEKTTDTGSPMVQLSVLIDLFYIENEKIIGG